MAISPQTQVHHIHQKNMTPKQSNSIIMACMYVSQYIGHAQTQDIFNSPYYCHLLSIPIENGSSIPGQ